MRKKEIKKNQNFPDLFYQKQRGKKDFPSWDLP